MDIFRRHISLLAAAALTAAFSSCATTVSDGVDHNLSAATATYAAKGEKTTPPTTEAPTEATTEHKKSAEHLRGNIYDCKGRLLMTTKYEEGETPRRISADEYAVPFANILTDMSEGYDTVFSEQLREDNPTPCDKDDTIGQSIQLTIDGEVQKAIYNYMQSMNIVGSVVVMRTDGSLMSQVSYPSYDSNAVADQSYDEKLAWGDCGNKAFQNCEPGSCFKIMSEVIADKHGVYSLYDEGEWSFDGTSIVNWDHDTGYGYPMERSLQSAFINSSNIFFAKAFDQIGKEAVLADLEEMFKFCSGIECDFGTMNNNVEIYCDDDLRRTAFGQSYVLTCPIYLAALGREAVFGDMVRPFVLKCTVDTTDPASVTGSGSKPLDVVASIPQEYRKGLLDGMLGVVDHLSVSVPAGYTLYAKTGTAETWKDDFLYITGCLKNDSDDGNGSYIDYSSYGGKGSYIIVMQIQNPAAHGFSFASESAWYYQGIMDIVAGK